MYSSYTSVTMISMMSFFYADLSDKTTLESDCRVGDDDFATGLFDRGYTDIVVFST